MKHGRLKICFLSLVFLWASCGTSESPGGRWRGTVTEENGVRTVLNPEDPVYGEMELELETELDLGDNTDDDNTIFFEAQRLDVDEAGNIYVVDTGNHRIQKFDAEGRFVLSIGKEGQGPGEFESVSNIHLSPDGTLYAVDGVRLQRFKTDGTVLSTIPLTNRISDFWITPDKFIYGVETRTTDEGRRRLLVRLDPEGNELDILTEFADVRPLDQESDGYRVRFVILHRYNPFLYIKAAPGEEFLYGNSADYAIHRCSADGTANLVIKKTEASRSISQAEKDRVIDGIKERLEAMGRSLPDEALEQGCQFPPTSPYYVDMFTDNLGRIFVRRLKSMLDESDTQILDVFGPEGHYLHRIFTETRPLVIRNGLLYELWEDEDVGTIKLRRHRIKNWDSLKTGTS
jgi:hypothetical protein